MRKTAPAVVNIYSKRKVRNPFADDPFFRRFFGNRGGGKERTQSALGSGVIVRADGIIVTNNHVVEGADEIVVALADRREFAAKVLLADARNDLAILRVNTAGKSLPTIAFHNSDDAEVGDIVLAIGNPFGVGQTVTSGIVSALARTQAGISDHQFFIQTDAAINPRQFRRRAGHHRRQTDRHQHGDLLALRRQHRHRLCDPREHGQDRRRHGARRRQDAGAALARLLRATGYERRSPTRSVSTGRPV